MVWDADLVRSRRSALGLGVSGFGLVSLAVFGLSPRRLPLADLAETFRLLAVSLVPAPWLVFAAHPLRKQCRGRGRRLLAGR